MSHIYGQIQQLTNSNTGTGVETPNATLVNMYVSADVPTNGDAARSIYGVFSDGSKKLFGGGGGSVTSLTYNQLNTLVLGSDLIPNAVYVIPFTTKANIVGAPLIAGNVITGAVENLMITASSVNTFYKNVISQSNPLDTIEYDFFDVLCEDGVTARPGKITYRKQNSTGNIAPFDLREVQARSWNFDPTAYPAWVTLTNYVQGDIVLETGLLYRCRIAHAAGAVFATDLAAFDWELISFDVAALVWANGTDTFLGTTNIEGTAQQDTLCFINGTTNCSIGKTSLQNGYGNVVFDGCTNVIIGESSENIRLVLCTNMNFAYSCSKIVGVSSLHCNLGTNFSDSYIGTDASTTGVTNFNSDAGCTLNYISNCSNIEFGKTIASSNINGANTCRDSSLGDQMGFILLLSDVGDLVEVHIGGNTTNVVVDGANRLITGSVFTNSIIRNSALNVTAGNACKIVMGSASVLTDVSFGNLCSNININGSLIDCSFGNNVTSSTIAATATMQSCTVGNGVSALTVSAGNDLLRSAIGEACNDINVDIDCTGLILCPGIVDITFSVAAKSGLAIMVPNVAPYVVAAAITNVCVDGISPDGSLWYDVRDNAGAVTPTKLV